MIKEVKPQVMSSYLHLTAESQAVLMDMLDDISRDSPRIKKIQALQFMEIIDQNETSIKNQAKEAQEAREPDPREDFSEESVA